ncbi:hypothetical protein LCGC14_0825730 [marine sediment metagenome]|uniref:Uncharacterized protein n=1 Tax=marine sediment metagenome TaxID=412755 RepID=A0A0F9Q2Q0_9ZZZZ
MATTTTTRLGLKKQAAGDNSGAWEVDLNQGFDDADAAFFLSGSGNPNGSENSAFVGQRYYDTSTGYWWTAEDIASPSSAWVSDFATIDADVTHPIPTTHAQDYTHGDIQAVLEWLSITEFQLRPIGGTDIYADISGSRVTIAGDFVFDVTTDREGAQTLDASTPYYLYLDNLTVPGTPEPVVSKTPPDDIDDTKPRYHPTEADHLCVGSLWIDSNTDVAKVKIDRAGKTTFQANDSDQITDLSGIASQADYRTHVLNVPLTAIEVEMHVIGRDASASWYLALAMSDAGVASLPNSGPTHFLGDAGFEDAIALLQEGSGPDKWQARTLNIPIADSSSPAIKYGHNRGNALDTCEFVIRGYVDRWAPKGF